MAENIICVDIFDNEIGQATKEEAHRVGQLHRAFSVFLIRDGEMLIQRRAQHKYHSGGLWANACCSHPRVGEQLKEAVPRRLFEELGVSDIKTNELFSFVYYHRFSHELFEYEYDHVFIGECSGTPQLNPDEADACRWVTFSALSTELREHPEMFAVWFLIAAPRVLSYLMEKKTDNC